MPLGSEKTHQFLCYDHLVLCSVFLASHQDIGEEILPVRGETAIDLNDGERVRRVSAGGFLWS